MAPLIGHGQQFEVNTTSSTYVAVAGLLSVDPGSNKVDALDTTDCGTSGIDRAYTGGLRNPGDYSLKFNYLPTDATQQDLRTLEDGTVHNFKWILPGGTQTRQFAGIITSIDYSSPDDKLITFTVKIQVSGPSTDTL